MIICLIGLSLIFLLLCLCLFSEITNKKSNYYYKKRWELYDRMNESGEAYLDKSALEYYEKKYKMWEKLDRINYFEIKTITILVSVIIFLILLLLFTGSKSEGKKDYQEYLLVKESIEYCIDNDITLDNLLVRAIEVNKEVQKHKDAKQNPWLSWFVYNDISNVEEIDLDYFK